MSKFPLPGEDRTELIHKQYRSLLALPRSGAWRTLVHARAGEWLSTMRGRESRMRSELRDLDQTILAALRCRSRLREQLRVAQEAAAWMDEHIRDGEDVGHALLELEEWLPEAV